MTEQTKERAPRRAAEKVMLTEARIRALQPEGKWRRLVYDRAVRGLAVKVMPSGHKSFVHYRRVNGEPTLDNIGAWGTGDKADGITLDFARGEAEKRNALLAQGLSAMEAKRAGRKAETVKELAARWEREHVDAHMKPTSAAETRRLLKLHILPELGNRKARAVSADQVSRFFHGMRETPYQANRARAILSAMFRKAEVWDIRPQNSNPCTHVKKFREAKRERFLSEAELARLGDALTQAERTRKESPHVVAAFRLLILTGARRSEIFTLQWQDVDSQNGVLNLRDSKTGPKQIHLNASALDVLNAIPRVDGNSHVIVGTEPGMHYSLAGSEKAWRRIREKAELPDVRMHDLRHSFASMAVAGGMSLPVLGALLGHTVPATTQRYAHLSADPLRKASEQVSDKLSAAMNAKPEPAKMQVIQGGKQ